MDVRGKEFGGKGRGEGVRMGEMCVLMVSCGASRFRNICEWDITTAQKVAFQVHCNPNGIAVRGE